MKKRTYFQTIDEVAYNYFVFLIQYVSFFNGIKCFSILSLQKMYKIHLLENVSTNKKYNTLLRNLY